MTVRKSKKEGRVVFTTWSTRRPEETVISFGGPTLLGGQRLCFWPSRARSELKEGSP